MEYNEKINIIINNTMLQTSLHDVLLALSEKYNYRQIKTELDNLGIKSTSKYESQYNYLKSEQGKAKRAESDRRRYIAKKNN